MIETKSNALTIRVAGICDISAQVPEMQGLQTQGGGATAEPPPTLKQNVEPAPVLAPPNNP